MDLFVLGGDFQREHLVDSYQSLIWTERYAEYGDFELQVIANAENRKLFQIGTWVSIQESNRVMKIRTVEDKADEAGLEVMTIKGLSMEAELMDRMARQTMNFDLEQTPTWDIRGWPANIARYMFEQVCLVGVLSFRDVWPNTQETMPANLANRIPEPRPSISVEVPPKDLYSAIKEVCDAYDLGFRVLWNAATQQFTFQVYTGFKRTADQLENTAVIFAPDLDNLRSGSVFSSIHDEKNVAYVLSKDKTLMVYAPGAEKKNGFDRRTIIVEVSDLPDNATEEELEDFLYDRGREALAAHRTLHFFDGEVQSNSPYLYGRDYELGDIVDFRNYAGEDQQMLISEQIFVSDSEGIRQYPTLMLASRMLEGTWALWPDNMKWNEAEGETWDSMP